MEFYCIAFKSVHALNNLVIVEYNVVFALYFQIGSLHHGLGCVSHLHFYTLAILIRPAR